MIESYAKRQKIADNLNIAIAINRKRGEELALAEREYRIALAQRIAKEQDKGTKVTIIGDICRGDKEVAELKYKRDMARVLYDSSQEAILCFKLELRVVQDDLQNERKGV